MGIPFFLLFFFFSSSNSLDPLCQRVQCDNTVPVCAEDSTIIRRPSRCCSEAVCVCDKVRCSQMAIKCEEGFDRVRVRRGTQQSGQCCDLFECRQRSKECRKEDCPKDVFDQTDCPEDSFRPLSYVPMDGCCEITPECRCNASICPPIRCGENEKILIERKGDGHPGRCCDRFRCEKAAASSVCVVNGVHYGDGDEWSPDSCQSCSCNGGVKFCRRMQCPAIEDECSWVAVPDGECCPVCLGCRDDLGIPHHIGEMWTKDDCTNCSCDESLRTSCQRSVCRTECDNPKKVEGQCCPVCDQPSIVESPAICGSVELCSLRCEFGLDKDEWGCFVCRCSLPPSSSHISSSSSNCLSLTKENCDRQCAHGYLRDRLGCLSCKCARCPPTENCYKSCLYGFETNSIGCPVCKCRPKYRIEARLSSDLGRRGDFCYSASTERDSGEWWSDGGCRQCFCEEGTEFCSLIVCPQRPPDCPLDLWVQEAGDCCPRCRNSTTPLTGHSLTVCHSPGTGHLFVDGETWDLSDCVRCTCRVGHVLCAASRCPPIPCAQPVQNPGNCCPLCSPASNISTTAAVCMDGGGKSRIVGAVWREGDCRSCRCGHNGQIQCFEEKCPKECSGGKWLKVKGRCCPLCGSALSPNGFCPFKENIYSIGEQFRDGRCRNCTCREKGTVECIQRECPHCDEPIEDPNQCCPKCRDRTPYSLEGQSYTVLLGENRPPILYGAVVGLALILIAFFVSLIALVGKFLYRNKIAQKNTPNGELPKPENAALLS